MDAVDRLNRRLALGALLLAALAAIAVHAYLSGLAHRALLPQTVPVLVAATNIPAHTTLTPAMLAVMQYAPGNRPVQALSTVAAASGAISTTQIYRGQAVVAPDLARPSAPPSLSFAIAPGMRAYTLAVSPVTAVGEMITPGDHVDVLAVFSQGTTTTVDTLLQDVPVLAVAQRTVGQSTPIPASYTDLTLQVTPAAAARLAYAASRGSLQLTLRAVTDNTLAPVAPEKGADIPGA